MLEDTATIKLPFNLLVFDWDGTLMDSYSHLVYCLQNAILDCSLVPPKISELHKYLGLTLNEALMQLYPNLSTDTVFNIQERYKFYFYKQDDFLMHLYPGVIETLRELKSRGYLLGVATGKGRQSLNDAFVKTGLNQLIDLSRCSDETFSKPNPQMLIELMEEADVKPQRTLMIGDTEYDLQLAANANVQSLLIDYGTQPFNNIEDYKLAGIIHDIRELIPWLEKHI